jgi:hypothetical protein
LATVITASKPVAAERRAFALRHPWDRNFFLVYVLLIWAAVLGGFVPEIVQNYATAAPPKSWMVRIHGAAFFGWLVLLIVQLLLIRSRKVRLHRRIGVAGAVLAGAMIVLGLGAALTVQKMGLVSPNPNVGFLSVQLIDMIVFAGLVAAAISARNQPSAHKRLILLATLSIADAGFSRWLGVLIYPYLLDGYWQFWLELFGGTAGMIALLGAYDCITRRRLHPAFVLGTLWILIGQFAASWLYHDAGWRALATQIIRAWPVT